MFLRSLYLLVVVVGLSQAQPCSNETESLFRIDFDITRKEFSNIYGENFYWSLRLDSNGTIGYEWYESFDQVPAFATQCIPQDECIVLSVSGLQTDQFSLQIDGEAITPGPPVSYKRMVL